MKSKLHDDDESNRIFEARVCVCVCVCVCAFLLMMTDPEDAFWGEGGGNVGDIYIYCKLTGLWPPSLISATGIYGHILYCKHY